jgi:ribosomal protein S12 methylthiotransferase accessory factor
MDIEVILSGGERVEARVGKQRIVTDQDGSAPRPFNLFLASIATCSGIYVARFCEKRKIPTDGMRIRQRSIKNPDTKMIERIEISIELPESFPEKYRDAVKRAVAQCTVKKHLEQPPAIEVTTSVAELAGQC